MAEEFAAFTFPLSHLLLSQDIKKPLLWQEDGWCACVSGSWGSRALVHTRELEQNQPWAWL